MEKLLYTKKEVAELLPVCTRTIDRWIVSNGLKASKFGRCIRIHTKDLDRYINRNVIK